MRESKIWSDQRGAALIEYALLIGLVTLTVLAVVVAVGSSANAMWMALLSRMPV